MLYITANIFGKNGIPGEFKEYEFKVLKIFKKHGGEIITTYVPVRDPATNHTPDEIHVLRIESQAKFQMFIQDPERIKMAEERDGVIKRTDVFISEEIINYFE